MRQLLLVVLLLGPLPARVSAQDAMLVGARVRAKLVGPRGPWVAGTVVESLGDSMTVRLEDNRALVRLHRNEVRVDRSRGRDVSRGIWGGAVVGAIATTIAMAATPDFNQGGLEGLLYLVLVPAGAAVGSGVGAAMAPERWEPVFPGNGQCGGWRPLEGSVTGDSIVVAGPRNVRRGVVRWTLILGGIGLLGSLTDPELPKSDVPGVVLSNAALGAVIGSFFGPRERVAIPLRCP